MFDSAQEGQAAELHFMLHNILRTKPAKHLFSLLAHLQGREAHHPKRQLILSEKSKILLQSKPASASICTSPLGLDLPSGEFRTIIICPEPVVRSSTINKEPLCPAPKGRWPPFSVLATDGEDKYWKKLNPADTQHLPSQLEHILFSPPCPSSKGILHKL